MRYIVKCWYGDTPGVSKREQPSRTFYMEAADKAAAQRYAEGQCWDAIQKYEVFETQIEAENEVLPLHDGERLMLDYANRVIIRDQEEARVKAYWNTTTEERSKLVRQQEQERMAFYRASKAHWDTRHEWWVAYEARRKERDQVGPAREQLTR